MWALWEPPCDPAGCAGAGTPKAGIMGRAQLPAHPMAPGKGLALTPYFLSETRAIDITFPLKKQCGEGGDLLIMDF